MVFKTVQNWMVLARVHTWVYAIAICLLGALLAPDWSAWGLVRLAVIASAYMAAGMIHNNIVDLPLDRKDPNKASFPLVTGTISPQAARTAFAGLLVLAIAAAVGPELDQLGWASVPIIATFATMVVMGFVYDYNSKTSRFGPFVFGAMIGPAPMLGYFVSGGSPASWTPWFLGLVFFLVGVQQIGCWGFLKDMESDPVNWMNLLGAKATRVGDGLLRYEFSNTAQAVVLLIGVAPIPLVLTSVFLAGVWQAVVGSLLAVTMALTSLYMAQSGVVERRRKFGAILVHEFATYWLILLAWPQIYGWPLVAFALGPLVWYAVTIRLQWGKWVPQT